MSKSNRKSASNAAVEGALPPRFSRQLYLIIDALCQFNEDAVRDGKLLFSLESNNKPDWKLVLGLSQELNNLARLALRWDRLKAKRVVSEIMMEDGWEFDLTELDREERLVDWQEKQFWNRWFGIGEENRNS